MRVKNHVCATCQFLVTRDGRAISCSGYPVWFIIVIQVLMATVWIRTPALRTITLCEGGSQQELVPVFRN